MSEPQQVDVSAPTPPSSIESSAASSSSKRARSTTPPPSSSLTVTLATSSSISDTLPEAKKVKEDQGEEAAANELPNEDGPSTAVTPDAPKGGASKQGGKQEKKSKRKWEGKDKRADGAEGGAGGWGDRRGGRKSARDIEDEAIAAAGGPPRPKVERLPKKKTVVMIGFSGTGCKGMQIQKDKSLKTIEGILFEALVKAGAVSQDNADDASKVSLARAARTDAGVHAAGNVVSLKMITAIPGIEDLTAHINSFLPDQVRMWGFVRVNSGFNARLACDSRVYEYLLPSHILLPPKPGTAVANMLKNQTVAPSSSSSSESSAVPYDSAEHPFWKKNGSEGTWNEDAAKRKDWRVDGETLERARAAIKQFEGTHNFHNYTVERSFNDRAAQRYMLKMDVREPVVFNGTEWISFRFHGQSFMLHQIRKMIGMVILVTRTHTPPSLIPETFGPRMIHTPKAPALGLLLEQPLFETHNTNVSKGDRFETATDPIDFEKYRETIDKFKIEQIYEALRDEEEKTDTFAKWVHQLDTTDHVEDFGYLNSKGIIPPSAVRVKGSRKPTEVDEEDVVDQKALKSGELEG